MRLARTHSPLNTRKFIFEVLDLSGLGLLNHNLCGWYQVDLASFLAHWTQCILLAFHEWFVWFKCLDKFPRLHTCIKVVLYTHWLICLLQSGLHHLLKLFAYLFKLPLILFGQDQFRSKFRLAGTDCDLNFFNFIQTIVFGLKRRVWLLQTWLWA